MSILARNKIVLNFAILLLATIAVFSPGLVFLTAAAIIFIALTFRFPTFGITAALFAACAGELGRIELNNISFLILDLVAPAVLLIWLGRKFLEKEKIELDRIAGSLLLFWAAGFLSLLVGSFELSGGEFKFALLHLLRFVGVSGLLLVARDLGKKQSAKAANILLGSGILFALSGFIILHILPDFTTAGLTALGWDPHIGRLTSTFLDPNFAGGAFAFLIALVGGRFLRERNSARQLIFLGIVGTFGIALLLTFSRSGLLALGVSGSVLGIFGDRRILLVGFLVTVLGIASSARLAGRVGKLAQSAESLSGESQQILDPTAQLRVDSWHEGIRIFEKKPLLGVGFGAYKFHQNFAAEDSHAATGSDASLLNVAATTGILGLTIFIIFLWNLASSAFRTKNWGFLAGLSGLLVHSIFVNSLFFVPIATIFFIAAGLAESKKFGARERT